MTFQINTLSYQGDTLNLRALDFFKIREIRNKEKKQKVIDAELETLNAQVNLDTHTHDNYDQKENANVKI